jgi:hypothetical protein
LFSRGRPAWLLLEYPTIKSSNSSVSNDNNSANMLSLRSLTLFFHWRVKICCYWYVLPSIALPDRHYPCCSSTCQFIQVVVPQNPLLIDEESAAINLQPETFTECTPVPLKRATLNTDGRSCVARSPDKGTTKRHRNTH